MHPGWRHRLPDGVVVLRDQAAALARLEELVDAELWREDRRTVALSVLRGLVHGMAWDTGLVAGVTRAHLAAAADCSTRTVSRIVAWAIDAGLVVCVEAGATAEFLGATSNRAPSYVLTAPLTMVVEELGNPPACGGWETSPRRDRGLNRSQDDQPGVGWSSWPVFDRAQDASERARAVMTLLDRAGLGGRVVRWRAVAMLGPWFAGGWCVAGLLHALDHHPDRPDAASRGDAARAARDPLRVLGHRLGPWRGRLDALPANLVAVDGQSRRARVATLAEADASAATAVVAGGHRPRAGVSGRPAASAETRAAAMAETSRVLSRPSRRVAVTGGRGLSRGAAPGVCDH